MKLKNLIVIVALAAAGIVALLWFAFGGGSNAPQRDASSRERQKKLIADAGRGPKDRGDKAKGFPDNAKVGKAAKRGRDAFKRKAAFVDTYSPKDRKLADAVQAALDDENLEQVRKNAAEAMKSENPDVRQEAVDALGWFEDKALVDLTRAMADKNAAVAESARSHVENALMGMEDDDRAFVLASEYVKMFAGDDEAVTMFSGVLSSAGSRIIDPDDPDSAEDVAKAKGNRAGIVDIVAEMIGKGGKSEEKGREIYEEIVGEKWTDRATADAWAEDIEEPEAGGTEDDSAAESEGSGG